MELIFEILGSGLILLLVFRILQVKLFGKNSADSKQLGLNSSGDFSLEQLKQRAEARRMAMKLGSRVEAQFFESLAPSDLYYCPSCLKENEWNSHFCVYCGKELNQVLSQKLAIETPEIDKPVAQYYWGLDLGTGGQSTVETKLDTKFPLTRDQEMVENVIPVETILRDTKGIPEFTNGISSIHKESLRGLRVTDDLNSRIGLRKAILLKEILGPPVSISGWER